MFILITILLVIIIMLYYYIIIYSKIFRDYYLDYHGLDEDMFK